MKRKPAAPGHSPAQGPSQRQLRVGEAIRHELSSILMRGDFRDPELRDLNVTVTEVRVSPDLRNASAFIAPLAGEKVPEALAGLRRAAPFLRSAVGKSLHLRHVPALRFEHDDSFDQASRIETLLRAPEVRRDLQPEQSDDTSPPAGAAGDVDGDDDGDGDVAGSDFGTNGANGANQDKDAGGGT